MPIAGSQMKQASSHGRANARRRSPKASSRCTSRIEAIQRRSGTADQGPVQTPRSGVEPLDEAKTNGLEQPPFPPFPRHIGPDLYRTYNRLEQECTRMIQLLMRAFWHLALPRGGADARRVRAHPRPGLDRCGHAPERDRRLPASAPSARSTPTSSRDQGPDRTQPYSGSTA